MKVGAQGPAVRFRKMLLLVYVRRMDRGDIGAVLLVDDEPDIRRIAQLALSKLAGWRVLLASSGDEAVEVARRESPDVILLDVMMPELDGPTTLERLRSLSGLEQVPVIFMTAKVQKEEIARFLALGAAGVIAKPFDPFELPDEIRKLVSAKA